MIGISMVSDDNHLITIRFRGLYGISQASVDRNNRFLDRLVHARMTNHIAIRIVHDDEIVLLRSDRLHQFILHLVSAHLRLQVVCSHFRRRHQDAILVIVRSLAATIEEESHVRVFLGLGDMELRLALLREVLAQCIVHVLLIEQDMNTLEVRVVRRHAEILQTRNRMHTSLRHILLRKHDRKLLSAVVAEIEEDDDIALLDNRYRLTVLHMHDRFDELVGHALGIRFLHRLHHTFGLLALSIHQEVVRLLHTLPTFVAVHRIITTYDRGYLATCRLQVVLQRLDKAFTALRIGIAAIHEAMHVGLRDAILLRDIGQLQQVLQRAMHATIGYQTHEMNLLVVLLGVAVRTLDLRILLNRILTARPVDLHQILVNDTSRSNIQMADLRVTHLSVGQTHVLARCLQLRVRISPQQLIPIRSRRARDHVVFLFVTDSPTITNN